MTKFNWLTENINWQNHLQSKFRQFRILVSNISNWSLDFGKSDVKSGIQISNQSLPKYLTKTTNKEVFPLYLY